MMKTLTWPSFNVSDDKVDPGSEDPPAGAGEGPGAVPGLLQPLHRLPQVQDAE